ncbi:Glycosyltransferase, group 2 family protein [Desulfosarcina cetonica]|nr:Glycosyltransferase, group 2 family protein [Desulfosarcina cetonica]
MRLSTFNPTLIIFGRYPVPGKTKTRLIPALGPAGAADLQRRLTERTVAAARQLARRMGVRLVFCHADGDAAHLQRWLGGKDLQYTPQANGDLGRRMATAIQDAFQGGAARVVLVGTDIPAMSATILKNAFAGLAHHDLVLGPSRDGGYWLVGLTRPLNLFDGIAWSTPDVLSATLKWAEQAGIQPFLLEPLADLDTPADLDPPVNLERIKPPKPYLSVIIPTLNEERQIGRTLESAAAADTETIVCDGGSTDATVAIARRLGARIVHGPIGRARQQNRGAAAAGGEVLLFLHADTRLPQDPVAHIFDTLMDRRVVLGAFRFATDLSSPVMRWISFWTNQRAGRLKLPYGDQGLFLRRRDFFRVGGFPQVPIAEDLYLVRRMARRGRIAMAPAAAITSARRWQRLGPLRTTLVNTLIATGCLAGMRPQRLASLYRIPKKRRGA